MEKVEEQFKEKLFKQLANTKGKNYYSTLLSYVEFVKKNISSQSQVDPRYLFNILRDAGYVYMLGIELDSTVLKDIENCFAKSNLTETNMIPSAFMNFSYLDSVIDHYMQTAKDFQPPPLWTTNLEQEDIWEDSLEELRENGLDLIMNGFDISAVLMGAEHFKEIISKTAFNSLWLKFEKESKYFYHKFYSMNKEYFYHLSDDITGLLEKFFHLTRNQYYKFLSDISKLHPDHEEHIYFREILSPRTAEKIYNDIEANYDENSSVALTYFFKAALALEVLHKFIKNKCFALLSDNTYKFSIEELNRIYKKDWQLSSNFESESQIETPMLLVGNKQYSLHISDSKIKFWGMRNDPKNHLALPLHNKNLNGALFCSWKQYANGALLVRFDSYINRDQFINIINNNQNEKFIKLNYNNIYQEIDEKDPRKIFLHEAVESVLYNQDSKVAVAKAAMEISVENDVLALLRYDMHIKTIAQNHVQHMIVAGGLFINAIQRKKRLSLGMGTGPSTPETNIFHIPLNVSEYQDKEIDLLPRAFKKNKPVIKSMDREQKAIYKSMVDFIDGNWHYFAYTLDDKGIILQEDKKTGKKGEIKDKGNIKYRVKKGAKMIFLCIAPEETINKVSQLFGESPDMASVPNENDNIIWLIYGASKKNPSKQ